MTQSSVLSLASSPQQGADEFDLLCALAGVHLPAHHVERIANWNFSALDWNKFLSLAEHHGVLPLAARNLMDHARSLPPEIERSLRLAYEANLRRNLWFSVELERILQHFERARLRVIPYKGPTLAQSVYGDVGLRSFSDLDLLINPADFNRAKQALAEIGYRPSVDLVSVVVPPSRKGAGSTMSNSTVERFWLRTGYERSFDSAAGKHLVELQWALLPRFYAVDFRIEDLMTRSLRTRVGEREVLRLCPEDLLLALSLHAAKHLWSRLIWLSDIAETLRTQPIDYSLVVSRARLLGVARVLGVSFWLLKNLLLADFPNPAEPMLQILASDPRIPALGREIAERLAHAATYDLESTDYFRLILNLRERRADRWRYLWRLLWTPGPGDVAAVRLPEMFFPLYRVVRIGRLMRKLPGLRP